MIVLRDETERKRLEEERDRFFALSMDMLCVAGLDRYFRRTNAAFEKTLGYSPEELLARPILDLIHPDDRPATAARFTRLAASEPVPYLENRLRCEVWRRRRAARRTPSPPRTGNSRDGAS